MSATLSSRHAFLALLVTAIWGSNFIAAKVALDHIPALLLSAVRFGMVAVLLLPWLGKASRTWVRPLYGISLSMGVLHFGLVYTGLGMGVSVAATAIATQLGVPFSCLLAAWLLNDPLGPRRIFGLVVAFAGVVVLAGAPDVLEEPAGFSLVVLGALCWGYSNLQMKRLGDVPIFPMLALLSLLCAPQFFLLSWVFEGNPFPALARGGIDAYLAIGYTAVFSTIVAYGLWYWLLKHYPMAVVTPFTLLAPVFAVGFSVTMLGESLSWTHAVGGLLTLVGVGVIVVRRPFLGLLDRFS